MFHGRSFQNETNLHILWDIESHKRLCR